MTNGNRLYARTAPFRVRQEAAGLVADCNFTQKEVATALSQLHPGRAKGMDELPVEVLRLPEFSDLILRLSNGFLDERPAGSIAYSLSQETTT
jgi:hypothetical protein